jgi:hypothetical protein
MHNLSQMYARGWGVAPDEAKARAWQQKANAANRAWNQRTQADDFDVFEDAFEMQTILRSTDPPGGLAAGGLGNGWLQPGRSEGAGERLAAQHVPVILTTLNFST